MPEISRFLGIVIGMFYSEHGVPHFHAVYGEHEVSIEIDSGEVFGEFPPRALQLVLEWAELHRAELLENWELARQGQPLRRIAPLE
jgi:hypothetical protein